MSKKIHLLVAALGLFIGSSVNAQTTLSQTGGVVPDDSSLSCTTQNTQGQTTGMSDNVYYRAYTMSSAMDISAVNVGAYASVSSTTSNGFPLKVTLYKSNGAFPGSYPSGLTQLATVNASIPDTSFDANNDPIPETVQVPLSSVVSVASGDIIVVEVSMTTTLGALFYVGAVSGSETATAYVRTTGCSIPNPITMAAAATQHNIPNLNGKVVIDLFEGTVSTEKFFQQHFSMYPNPVTDVLNIDSVNGLNVNEIRILDMTGKVIKVQKDASSINVADLAAGTYLIDITTNEGKATSKFIKK